MGDRTSCTLSVAGVIHGADDWAMFYEALTQAGVDTRDVDDDSFGATPPNDGPMPAYFTFHDVNGAEIDGGMEETLTLLGLSFSWSWDAGDNYGEGVEIYEPGLPVRRESCIEGELFLTLSETRASTMGDRIAELEAFDADWARIRKTPFVYAGSAHALLAHFAGDMEAFACWKAKRDERNDLGTDEVAA